MREGRPAEAVALFEQAAAGTDVEPFIDLAEAALAAGERGKARTALNEALRRSAGHPWTLAITGRMLAEDGQRAAAIDYLRRALAAGPRRPAVWRSLAAGFDAAGAREEAAQCRRRADGITGSHSRP
jgi:predicted Zn-dependent protease